MKTLLRLLFWLCVIAGLAALGFWLTRTEPPSVTVHTVGRGLVEASVANTRAGTIKANRRAKLAPSYGGQVDALHVKEGDRVKAGAVLIELWHADLDAELALAQSELRRAEAIVEQRKIQAEFAERDAKRQEELQKSEIGAEGTVDRLVTEAKAARAGERAARAEVISRARRIEVIEAQIARMRVTAPFDGIIAELNGEVGEFVTPSPVGIPTPPAVDLIDAGTPYVTAPIDEVDAARVRTGMTARITLDAFGKRAFEGRVRRIAPYVTDREKQARTVDVEVEFTEAPKDAELLPGYSADVEILLEAREDVLRVPAECLREGGVVLLVTAENKIERRTISTGLANWRFAEVLEGLAEGDRIVGSFDHEGLEEGVEVRIGEDGEGP